MINAGRLSAKPSLFATDLHAYSFATLIHCYFQTISESHLHETNGWTVSFSSLSQYVFTVSNVKQLRHDGKEEFNASLANL